MPSLTDLLKPFELSAFFADFYGRSPLHVRSTAPERFQGLLSLADIDRLFSTVRFRTSDIYLKDASQKIDVTSFTIRNDLVDMAKVIRLHCEGASVVINRLHTYHPPLAELCYALEAQFSAPCQANVYLSPPNAQGLKPHFDTHDVFVLQAAGSKHWKLYGQPIPKPLSGHVGQVQSDPGTPVLELDLSPGDLLYIPRGVVHEANALEDTSLHISLGVFSFTWADILLETLATAVLSDATFRSSLPIHFASASADTEAMEVEYRRLAEHFARSAQLEPALESLRAQLSASRRPDLSGQLLQLALARSMTKDTRLKRRRHTEAALRVDDSCLRVLCNQSELQFPLNARDVLEFAIQADDFSVDEIPGELNLPDKLAIIRQLVHAQALIVEPRSNHAQVS